MMKTKRMTTISLTGLKIETLMITSGTIQRDCNHSGDVDDHDDINNRDDDHDDD